MVEKYIGDVIMAVFGLPRLHEDDALRAVRAAAQMREAVADLDVTLRAGYGVILEHRTGVSTGEVVTGVGGGSPRLATGETVNVAAQLERAASAGEILIGESTYRLVRDAVEVVPAGPFELQGKSEPVPAYRLVSVTADARSSRPTGRPLVGRARELAALHAEFRRSVAGPEGRLVAVVGEAGVGKSRLIEEFVRGVAGQAAVLRGHCLFYGDGITFFAVAGVLRQAAAIVPEDSEEDARIKLQSCFGEQLADATSRIESVLGLSEHPYGRDELFWAVRAVLEELARRRPLVVVFDDIHWAEPTFLDLIENILDVSLGVPVLFVCAARRELGEDRPGFAAGRPAASQVELGELSQEECALVARNFLGEAGLPRAFEQRILGLAEGNPLFVEQVLSMLVDDGLLRELAGHWVFSGAAEDTASSDGPRRSRRVPSKAETVPGIETPRRRRGGRRPRRVRAGRVDADRGGRRGVLGRR
jgi:AAA ATPase domain/Adenylate and Guanylate cyclase catalytic domain